MIAFANFLLFTGLTIAIGAVTLRYLLLTRSGLSVSERAPTARHAAGGGAIGAALILVATFVRAAVQVQAFADPGEPWLPVLRAILDTGLGRALQLQAIWSAAALMAFSVARLGRQRGWSAAAIAMLVCSLTPALGGHAAAAEQPTLAMTAATVHVLAAGAWIGGLFHLYRASGVASELTLTRLLQAFHVVALSAAGALAFTGLYHVWTLLPAPSALWTSAWGRLLVSKLVVLGGVLWLGYRHWKGSELSVATGDRVGLRTSLAREVALALLVLLLTGVLTSVTPEEV
ncbi:MAG: copper resistance D family protein [Gemmatimonadaceae bacterium]